MALHYRNPKPDPSSHGFTALSAILVAVGWLWLVAGIHIHEMIVGVGVVALATLFISVVYTSEQEPIDLRWSDVAQCWRIPWYVASGIWEISVLLFKDLFARQRTDSFYRVCGFRTSTRDPATAARGILATVYTTIAPNFIVIGIDPELSQMLFHQIERSSVPKMTQALGAEP